MPTDPAADRIARADRSAATALAHARFCYAGGTFRFALAAALSLVALPAQAERAWFPVTGEATAGGSFGKHSIGHGNLFLGYQHGYRFEGDESGVVFAAGPVFTQRWFEPRSVGCPSSSAYVDGSTVQSSGCGNGYSVGLQLRAGLAWDLTDDHHHEVPDHVLYVGIAPLLFGSEPRLSLQDGSAHDHSLRGIRAALGWNFMAWSRFLLHLPLDEKKDDVANILIMPLALISKFELHYEHVALSNDTSDDRFGIVSGFGF